MLQNENGDYQIPPLRCVPMAGHCSPEKRVGGQDGLARPSGGGLPVCIYKFGIRFDFLFYILFYFANLNVFLEI